MSKNQKALYRAMKPRKSDSRKIIAIIIAIIAIFLLLGVMSANGQKLPGNANVREFNLCLDELRSLNDQYGDMRSLKIGDPVILPPCANSSLFVVDSMNANIVRTGGGWGILRYFKYGRFPNETASVAIVVEDNVSRVWYTELVGASLLEKEALNKKIAYLENTLLERNIVIWVMYIAFFGLLFLLFIRTKTEDSRSSFFTFFYS